jgi:hypothetical protein
MLCAQVVQIREGDSCLYLYLEDAVIAEVQGALQSIGCKCSDCVDSAVNLQPFRENNAKHDQ